MALDKLVLIIACVLIATGVTFWLAVMLIAMIAVPFFWLALIPAGVVRYNVFRVIAQRVGNSTEDHYDGIEL